MLDAFLLTEATNQTTELINDIRYQTSDYRTTCQLLLYGTVLFGTFLIHYQLMKILMFVIKAVRFSIIIIYCYFPFVSTMFVYKYYPFIYEEHETIDFRNVTYFRNK